MVDTGHAPWIDDPDRVAARVGAFLRACRPDRRPADLLLR